MEARNRQSLEIQIQQLMESGLNCAEAILHTFLDEEQINPSGGSITRMGSGLMGGIGGSQSGTCGALLGCILVLGQLYGRDNAGDDNQEIKTLAAEFLVQFEEKHGATSCGKILGKMDREEISLNCQELTGEAAKDLHTILSGIKNQKNKKQK